MEKLIEVLDLASIKDREVSVYSISAKSSRNVDLTLGWYVFSLRSINAQKADHFGVFSGC